MVLVTFDGKGWESNDVIQQGLDAMLEILRKAEREKARVTVVLNTTNNECPPMVVIGRIVAVMLSRQELIEAYLKKTIFRYSTEEHLKFLGWVLYFYIPQRPVYATDNDDLVRRILGGENPEGTLRHPGNVEECKKEDSNV